MKKLFSTRYSAGSFNIAMLILRLGLGILLVNHGYDKLTHIDKYEPMMINFLGLGQKTSLYLVIFAEFFCSIFLILGLLTRLITIPLIILMCVIVFKIFKGNIYDEHAEPAALYLAGFIALLFTGPGKISVDGLIGK